MLQVRIVVALRSGQPEAHGRSGGIGVTSARPPAAGALPGRGEDPTPTAAGGDCPATSHCREAIRLLLDAHMTLPR
jgi:hypothetical protein